MNPRLLTAPRNELVAALLLIMAFAFVLYSGSFSHPWLHDDLLVIVENPDIRSFGAFLENRYPGRPLRELTYLVDYQLFALTPAGWHIQSIFWHGLCAGLLFFLSRRLRLPLSVAIGAALIFLVHPLQVEAVANVANRKESLALCATLGSLLAWVHARASVVNKAWPWYGVSVACFGLALMGKQHTIVIPFIIVLWELLLAPEEQRRQWLGWRHLFGMMVAGLLSVAVWLVFLDGAEWFADKVPYKLATLNVFSRDLGDYYRAVFAGWGELLRRLPVPTGLAPEYVYPIPDTWTDPRIVLPLVIVSGLLIAVFWLRNREPVMTFAIAWFLLFWLPVSNLLPLAYFVADRYMYSSMVGAALLAALLIGKVATRSLRWGLLGGVLMTLSVLTWQQNFHWSSARALWGQAVAVSPTSANALSNLGDALVRDGEFGAAIERFRQAILYNPAAPYPFYNLGVIYDRQGDQALALYYFDQFLLRADQSPVRDHRLTAGKLRAYLRKKYGR